MNEDATALTHSSKRRRQDPVSCRLCRVKKLKCDRQRPCSNCTARSTLCEFEPLPRNPGLRPRCPDDAEPTNTAILARLSRLENVVARMGHGVSATPESMTMKEGVSPDARSLSVEVSELQSVGAQMAGRTNTSKGTVLASLADGCVFEIVPLSEMSSHSFRLLKTTTTRIILPTNGESLLIFERLSLIHI